MSSLATVPSTHKAEVFQIERIDEHLNANQLEIVRFAGYQTVVRKGEWKVGDKAVFVCPDSTVKISRPEFAFLAERAKSDGRARIKAMKLRGELSFGLLVPAPAEAQPGDDVAAELEIEHYQPPTADEKRGGLNLGGETESPPSLFTGSKYDVESFRRYHHHFSAGEAVAILEKIDGCFTKTVWWDGRLWVSSRNEWKKRVPNYSHVTVASLIEKGVPEEKAKEVCDRIHSKSVNVNGLWEVIERTEGVEKYCFDHPGTVVCGEVFGNVNCIKYGLDRNQFRVFDLMRDGKYLDMQDAIDDSVEQLPWVPFFTPYEGVPYDFDKVCELAEGTTLVEGAKKGVIREGVVVRPLKERFVDRLGRLHLKCVSAAYLEKYR